MNIRDKLGKAPTAGSLKMDDYWIWGGSVIKGEDGRYHMFATRWSKLLTFTHWATNAEIIRASADNPTGPFAFEEVVLGARDPGYWDGCSIHNPTIHKCRDTFLLYYSAQTFSEPMPTADNQAIWGDKCSLEAWNNQRIGVAYASSVKGPWTRLDAPVLEPRPDKWDGIITTNPTVSVKPDGSVLMIYKSISLPYAGKRLPCKFRFGVAQAEHFLEDYKRMREKPLFENFGKYDFEDPYMWFNGDSYEMVCKDMNGACGGEEEAGVYLTSNDGIQWNVPESPKAYSLVVNWDNGETSKLGKLERPQLLIEKGQPTHAYFALAEGDGHYVNIKNSRNIVIPLE